MKYYLKSCQPYIDLFYVLGFSPFHDATKPRTVCWMIAPLSKYAIAIICATIVISNIYWKCHDKATTLEIFMFIIMFTCDLLRVVCVLLECLLNRQFFVSIHYLFGKIESYFYIHLQHRIAYSTFKKQLNRKAVFMILAYVQYMMATFAFVLHTRHLDITVYIKLLQTMTVLTYLHIFFYVEALNFHLNQLNMVIVKGMANKQNCLILNSKIKYLFRGKLKSIKFVHFQLWMVAEHINKAFGWSIIIMLFYTFIDVLYCLSWLYFQIRYLKKHPVYALSKLRLVF